MTSEAALSLMTVNRDEVDGVPVYWADAPGPLRACLTFRVGMADEELARSGLTHVVEHLALHHVGQVSHDYNGVVERVVTRFMTAGDASDVVQFMSLTSRALSQLPLDRFERERDILRAEQLTRGGGIWRPLLIWRYGAQTYGIPAYGEPGLPALAAADVEEWAAQWFTTGNAALWLSGPPPAGLRLNLPEGPRREPPAASCALRRTPAWFTEDDIGGVGVSAIVPRSSAAMAYADVLGQALYADLRHAEGASYSPQVSYERRDGRVAEVVAYSDSMKEHYARVRDGTVHSLRRLAEDGPSSEELTRWRARHRRQRQEPLAVLGYVDLAMWDDLCGEEVRTPQQLLAEEEAVDIEAVRDVARAARGSALYALPPGVDIIAQFAVRAPECSRREVYGDVFRPVADPHRSLVRLIVGKEGLSLRVGGKPRTVLFDEVAVLFQWDDGGRHVIGEDGFGIQVEPTLWRRGARLPGLIDAAVPARKAVAMGQREEVPKPARDVAALVNAGLALGGWAALVGVLTFAVRNGHLGGVLFATILGAAFMFGWTKGAVEDWWSTRR